MAELNGGENQGIYSPLGDARKQVGDKLLDSAPYLNIVRLVIEKDCECGKFQGTAFLVGGDQSTKHCYYLTAAHNLCCFMLEHENDTTGASVGSRLAKKVLVFGGKDPGESVLCTGTPTAVQDGAPPEDRSWFRVHPNYLKFIGQPERHAFDVGVIALLRDEVEERYWKSTGFAVDDQLSQAYSDCAVSGFPLKLHPGTANQSNVRGHKIYEHSGEAMLVKVEFGRCLRYKIDTSQGQSGSPVWLKKERPVVIGLHSRDNREIGNQAVPLRQQDISFICRGFL